MIPGSIDCQCTGGELEIDGESMHTFAWCVTDVTALWVPTPPYRGKNVVIPGAEGQRPYPLRIDQAHIALPMVISGVVDDTGAEYGDPWVGLTTNVTTLRGFLDAPAAPTATVPAQLTLPDATVLTADVQVDGIRIGVHVGPVFRATLDLTIPAGRFL
jgi:hypothetical protein